jgi:hypothetical protein
MPAATAVNAYVEINQVVIGAAISMMRREALESLSVDDEGRHVPWPDILGDYRPTLERIILGYEADLSTIAITPITVSE